MSMQIESVPLADATNISHCASVGGCMVVGSGV